jgi:hypothetical protein
VAELLQCDRCKKTERGHIKRASATYAHNMQAAMVGVSDDTPSIQGWRFILGRLLCSVCETGLEAWLGRNPATDAEAEPK